MRSPGIPQAFFRSPVQLYDGENCDTKIEWIFILPSLSSWSSDLDILPSRAATVLSARNLRLESDRNTPL
jgi:hypothetical protein